MNPTLQIVPIFPTPIGYVNFGEESRELNKLLINDIETEMATHASVNRSFSGNDSAWASEY